jgi:hypothetical protein
MYSTLLVALAFGGLALGQASNSASSPEGRVGKTITVTEAGRGPEKCVVLQVWRLADGSTGMIAKATDSGDMMSIVEWQTPKADGERFRVYRWGPGNVPLNGCPVPQNYTAATAPVMQVPYRPDTGKSNVVHASGTAVPQPLPAPGKGGPVVAAQPAQPLPAPKEKAAQPAAAAATPAYVPVNGHVVQCGDCEVGKIITVAECNCKPQRCVILSVCCEPHGGKTMQVKSLETGECMTIVEARCSILSSLLDRFKIYRCCHDTCPPAVCSGTVPCTPGKDGPAVTMTTPTSTVPTTEMLPAPKEISMPAPVQQHVTKTTLPAEVPARSRQSGEAADHGTLLPPSEAPAFKGKDKPVTASTAPATEKPPTVTPEDKTVAPTRVMVPAKPQPSLAESTMSSLKSRLMPWKKESVKKETVKQEVLPEPTAKKPEEPKTAKKPEEPKTAKKAEEPKPAKIEEVKKTETITRVVSKPEETAKTAAVQPATVKPAEPVKAKSAELAKPELPVPVPLVPLVTANPRPEASPPQPPINSFSTLQSNAMAKYAPQTPLPAVCPICRRPMETGPSSLPVQQVNGPSAPGCPTCSLPVAGPVSGTRWTRGPAEPVSQSPVMVNVRRLVTEPEAQSMQNTVYLMTVLQASGVPTQREWAAQKLRGCDPQAQPYVVDALLTAAKTDGAAIVRAASIQSLAHMKVSTPPVLSLLEHAKTDVDPRVRDEAIQAVRYLTSGPGGAMQPGVIPASKR